MVDTESMEVVSREKGHNDIVTGAFMTRGEEVHHRQFLLLLSRPIRELFLPPAAAGAGRVRSAGAAHQHRLEQLVAVIGCIYII